MDTELYGWGSRIPFRQLSCPMLKSVRRNGSLPTQQHNGTYTVPTQGAILLSFSIALHDAANDGNLHELSRTFDQHSGLDYTVFYHPYFASYRQLPELPEVSKDILGKIGCQISIPSQEASASSPSVPCSLPCGPHQSRVWNCHITISRTQQEKFIYRS